MAHHAVEFSFDVASRASPSIAKPNLAAYTSRSCRGARV
jgi:hypothetical protein